MTIEVNCAGPENNHSESLVCPGEVTPDNVEVHLRKNGTDAEKRNCECKTFYKADLIDLEPVSKGQTSCAECSITRGDRACNDTEHSKDCANAGTHVAYADIINCAARAASFQSCLKAACAVEECNACSCPDQADDTFCNHGAVEYWTSETFIFQAAGHERRLGGMETGNSAASNGDEH